jgi:N12 class adenine-specific DNA methylase
MARKRKIDPRQNSFDFEVAADMADRLDQLREQEDENENRTEKTPGNGPEGIERKDFAEDSAKHPISAGSLLYSGQVGRTDPGRVEEAGRGIDDFWNLSSDAADQGTGSAAEREGRGTVAERPDASRTFGDERSKPEHSPVPGELTEPPAPVKALNYAITADDQLGVGGAKKKFRDNIEAIKTLSRLRETGASAALPEDQKVLVKYVGWGGLPQVFDSENTAWAKEYQELLGLLTPEEYAQARRSTQDAHYTSKEVIEGLYNGLDRLGFSGSFEALEPSAGIGHFIGLMPDKLKNGSHKITAVELDSTTAAIGKYLYPETKFISKGFHEVTVYRDHFDLVLGNPPFGNQHLFDASRPDLDYSVHNYFLAKSIDSLRDGGLAAFVVSRYFLDAVNNPARGFIAEKANLLGAIRLPNNAFRQNALTDVTTDLVFFQRTNEPEKDPVWLNTGEVADQDGNPITINQYFVDHPGQMAGRMALTRKMFRESADLLPSDDFQSLSQEIEKRLSVLPRGLYIPHAPEEPDVRKQKDDPNRGRCAGLKMDAFFVLEDGRIGQRRPDLMGMPQYGVYQPKNETAAERIKGMVEIRDRLTALMSLEQQERINEADLAQARQKLNHSYDKFKQRYGFLNSLGNKQALRDDPQHPLLLSLEREYDPGISKEVAKKTGREPVAPSAKKAAIFKTRVLGPRPKITNVDTPKEALVVSMNEFGRPDLEFMESLCGQQQDDLVRALGGLIYLNPGNTKWELADHYLTGNVKDKLKEAQTAAETNTRFKDNVEALLAVQPPDLDPVDISIQLGSNWVPSDVIKSFAQHLMGRNCVNEIDYHPALGAWVAEFNVYSIDRTIATSTWGTERYPAHKLLETILNKSPVKVMDRVEDGPDEKPRYVLNPDETAAAVQKADEMRQAFADWVWEDQARRGRLARIYNDKFNTHIPRKYDGSHLTLAGSSLDLTLRPHQKDAIWRGIQDGSALYHHVVGAGKTLVCVGTVMESKRMGLMKKPMIVVPNHLLTQWQDAFYSLYPQANILVADKSDFKKENRQQLFSKIATGDWDAVVVAHSSFTRIGLPEETLEKVLTEQVDDLTVALEELKNQEGKRFLVKQMEKARERLQSKMERRAAQQKKDKAITFADLGCDALIVDESHEYKNLLINTSLRNVAGLGNLQGSEKAFDLFVKVRYLQEKYEGRGLYFATGTPISNSMAELYTVQRYLQHDELKRKDLLHFDSWASTFGEVATGWELDATGVGYKLNNRFSKFVNLPELSSMYRTFADVITNADLVEQNQGQSFTPKVKGGKPQVVVVPRSHFQADYMGVPDFNGQYPEGSIIHRMENLPKDPRLDNPLKITNDARKAGLDYRLVNPAAPDCAESKVNAAAERIYQLWQKWAADKGTQLVFCDLSTPKTPKSSNDKAVKMDDENEMDEGPTISMDEILAMSSDFSVYEDLRRKLIDQGIPADEIKFIHEAKTDQQKAKLFDDLNKGRVRVLMGSTSKMGAGTNVQERLVAEHHLDAPWRPSDLQQREGRIIRQGNELFKRDPDNFEVEIIRYATEQTYDARMWQCIQVKAESIEQFMRGDQLGRVVDDIAGEAANAAEMKAAATGNELIFTQVQLAAELKKMEGIYATFVRGRHSLESRIANLEGAPARAGKAIANWQAEIAHRDQNSEPGPDRENYFAVNGKIYGEKHRQALANEVGKAMKMAVATGQGQKVGLYRGYQVGVEYSLKSNSCQFVLKGPDRPHIPVNLVYHGKDDLNINGFLQRIDNFLGRFESFIGDEKNRAQRQAEELATAKQSQGQEFPQKKLLEALRRDNREVMAELRLMQKNPRYKSNWEPLSRKMREGKVTAQGLTQEKSPAPASRPSSDAGVAWIQVGDRGAFPVFDDRAMAR